MRVLVRLHRPLGLLAGGLLLALAVSSAPTAGIAGQRHAGTVLAVDAPARTLVLDEFIANGERRAFRGRVPREAVVLLSQRSRSVRDLKDTFKDTSISLAYVRVGDFVVVEMEGEADVAKVVTITLRGGAGS